ncbi:MAG TPA: D-aminoacyl-tRNA deacylase [Patescibacteria group bacterium]|nr:D-aminoacyl-tRNA deacylase [Patescibacteria group bacterium]
MRIVVQRVKSCKVSVSEKTVGEIGNGFLVLLGIKRGDSEKDVEELVDKLYKLRIMSDQEDKMNLTVTEAGASILVVSQFTLYANTKKGNRPSFIQAEDSGKAEVLYKKFVSILKEKNVPVQTGEFGSYMKIDAQLDGPVTIILESGK